MIMSMNMNRCKKCTYEWKPKKKVVKECPNCKSRYWNKDDTNKLERKA